VRRKLKSTKTKTGAHKKQPKVIIETLKYNSVSKMSKWSIEQIDARIENGDIAPSDGDQIRSFQKWLERKRDPESQIPVPVRIDEWKAVFTSDEFDLHNFYDATSSTGDVKASVLT
jgi:hypothetical protein